MSLISSECMDLTVCLHSPLCVPKGHSMKPAEMDSRPRGGQLFFSFRQGDWFEIGESFETSRSSGSYDLVVSNGFHVFWERDSSKRG